METGFDLGSVYVTVDIDYKIWPGEAEVRYYPDGSGHPGTPDEIEILEVVVTSCSGETYDFLRDEKGGNGWLKDLDCLATAHVEDDVASHGWISEHILENEHANDCD